jgi:hypothetical protein
MRRSTFLALIVGTYRAMVDPVVTCLFAYVADKSAVVVSGFEPIFALGFVKM